MRQVPYWYWLLVGLTALGGVLAPQSVFEAAPKLLLMPTLWWALRKRLPLTMQIGLLCAWIGDGFLLWANHFLFFLAGMGAFGLMWLFYGIAWWRIPAQPSWPRIMVVGATGLTWAIGLIAVLWPALEKTLQITLPAYVGLLLIAAVLASRHQSSSLLLGLGAFWLSDSLIAVEAFVVALPGGAFAILALYGLAQALLTATTANLYSSTSSIS